MSVKKAPTLSSLPNNRVKTIDMPSLRSNTEQYIEGLATSFIEAINSRNLSPDSAPWHHLPEHFHVNTGTGARPNATNTKASMLAAHQRLADANPEYRIFITGMNTVVEEKTGAAQVVINATSTGTPGVPVGIQRRAVTILEFERGDGQWLAMAESTMSGIGRMDEGWF